MNSVSSRLSASPLKHVALAGLLAGALDAIAAIIVYQAKPGPMFKFIASGLLGKSAFEGGAEIILLGVLIHFAIAFCWTAIFFFLYPRLRLLQLNKPVTIVLYGVFIWIGMNMIVLPLVSRIDPGEFALIPALKGTAILIVAVSLPVCLIAFRYYRKTMFTDQT